MARLRGRRLADLAPADMEAIEERIETAALNRHLSRYDDHDEERPEEWDE